MKARRLGLLLGALLLLNGAAAQKVEALAQNAPVELAAFNVAADGAQLEISVTLANRARERRVAAVALGVVMVDAFNDVIAVKYARWTEGLGGLEGEGADLSSGFTEFRAEELFLAVPFVYAVRFEDGEVWKEDLSSVATLLLSRFEAAVSPSTLQP